MNEGSKPAVQELLQLVGTNVTELRVFQSSVLNPLDDWLCSLVRVCQWLKRLKLVKGAYITSMDVFVKMYEETSFWAESLELDRVQVDDVESITRFMRSMGDERLKISKTLHKISLDFKDMEVPLDDLAPTIDATLNSNIRLQEVDVLITYESHVPPANFYSLGQKHTGNPVAVRASPLSLSQKHAFCRALASFESHSKRRNVTSSGLKLRQVMRQLDHHVVSLIFQFAAECKKRKVSVWFHTNRDEDDYWDEDDVQDDGANDEEDESEDEDDENA